MDFEALHKITEDRIALAKQQGAIDFCKFLSDKVNPRELLNAFNEYSASFKSFDASPENYNLKGLKNEL